MSRSDPNQNELIPSSLSANANDDSSSVSVSEANNVSVATGATAVSASGSNSVLEGPNNGWTPEIEVLIAEWADKASCYRWMHDKTERIYHTRDQSMMLPIIILSTLGGAANFAMNSISQDPSIQTYLQLGLGGLSIATAILTTVANRLAYGSGSEAHRAASISWGKFNRLITIELALHPEKRIGYTVFMKMFRNDLDRIIEQSPAIPELVINSFIKEFKKDMELKKPDITGDLRHTHVFTESEDKLRKIAEDALANTQKNNEAIKQAILDSLDDSIRRIIKQSHPGVKVNPVEAPKKETIYLKIGSSKPEKPDTMEV